MLCDQRRGHHDLEIQYYAGRPPNATERRRQFHFAVFTAPPDVNSLRFGLEATAP